MFIIWANSTCVIKYRALVKKIMNSRIQKRDLNARQGCDI